MEPLVNHFLPGLATLSAKELEHCAGLLGGNLEGHYSGYEQRRSHHYGSYCYFIFIPSPLVYHIHLVLTRDGWGRRDQKSRQLLSLEPRGLNGKKVQSVDEQAGPGAARTVHKEKEKKSAIRQGANINPSPKGQSQGERAGSSLGSKR